MCPPHRVEGGFILHLALHHAHCTLPFLHGLACLAGDLSIDGYGPGLDPLLESGARLLRKTLGKKPVEPLPVGLGVHEKAKPVAIIRRVWRILRR